MLTAHIQMVEEGVYEWEVFDGLRLVGFGNAKTRMEAIRLSNRCMRAEGSKQGKPLQLQVC